MASYSKKIVKRICELISNDSFTIKEICEDVAIAESTFYKWKAEKSEFSEAVEAAQQKFNENLIPEAKRSLKKLVTGYTVTEIKTVTVDSGKKNEDDKPIVKVKEHSKTEKHIQPNFNAVAFALTNMDPENWKNKQNTELTGKNGEPVVPSVIVLPSNNREDEAPQE
ncbi:phBC6A51 family helix-turn-helix protein [Mariniphaga sediminis]|uniref:phBC6A51 family helix-turn-helix protein n=1 Tax=Mariniphaga sediminis TaxID=1628158 RepID=UPI00356AEBB9